ncbi:site-specific DNA-methyltransferase [Bradyrhizobium cosmicum]|uniref:site-specific DNA-methyltransferase n=1 Tax=Bradyrhizobium cosmicum TaxID=1404864 RepID=UPI0011644E1E|nr:site-specific DNA-methyltransferase [Bradyrhizobium cosmicum]QDP22817.1 site-specific DNA-methyltransferase [Bradyrhizobium cosmicum]
MPILNWLTRDDDIRAARRVPYRLLEETSDLSAGDPATGNMLIQGHNLDALKALLPFYAGQVKCIYIDPPFNTGQAFEHYDDNIEHSIWLGMMYARLESLRDLLAPNGTIAIHLDDEELAYLIVILDEVFGRRNRINICTFRQGAAVGHKAINPGVVTVSNYIVIYARDKANGWKPNRVFTRRERDSRYASYIENFEDDYAEWRLIPLSQGFAQQTGETPREQKKRLGDDYEAELDRFVLANPDRVVQPVPPAYDGVGQETRDLIDKSRNEPDRVFLQIRQGYSNIYIRNGKRWLFYREKLKEIDGELVSGEPLTNIWDDLLSNNLHNEGGVSFPKGKKPEALIKRVLELFTAPGDLVLDSFLGSGTTAAVAHKMGRRYVGIEMGEHAVTHCVPRLKKVIEGEQGGISESVGWKGGGGFRFYRLGPPVFDEEGHIRPDIAFPLLAAHIWFSETATPRTTTRRTPFLGIYNGRAFALLYNGILGDKRPEGGNVLTRATLALIRAAIAKADPSFAGPVTVYGEQSRITAPTLEREAVTFKQTPYDVKARR